MRVLGVMGSPRPGGNSDLLLEDALGGARATGAETEKIILYQKKISGCLDCEKCNETGICVIQDDMAEIHRKILEADAVIHSVPVYFWSMTAQMKAYLDRWCAFYDGQWRWHPAYLPRMKDKPIGLITVCGDQDVSTAGPVVLSFKTLCSFSGLKWMEAVQVSASDRGEIARNEKARSEAYSLGRRIAAKEKG